jgi:uncharacterized protein (TIGR00255 family)
MLSMTGFGRATAIAPPRCLIIEIRSVNHRSFDIQVRGRDVNLACEMEIIQAVRAAVERGSIVVHLSDDSANASLAALAIDGGAYRQAIRETHALLESIRQELRIDKAVDLDTILGFLRLARGGDRSQGKGSLEAAEAWAWPAVRPALEEALGALENMRAREGAAMAADLHPRLERIADLRRQIAARAATAPKAAARRLQEHIAALAADPGPGLSTAPGGLDPARLAQEVAYLADKLDVTEELARLGAHLAQLGDLWKTSAKDRTPVGRKSEFVIQEMGRELNTIGSKSQDADVISLVIEGKAELEKIREQAQNIQ